MEIDFYTIADYDQLLALWDRTGLPCDARHRDSRDMLERQIFDDHTSIFVLRQNELIIGSVIASSDGRKGWINRLAIDPEYRGRHLAQRLLEKAEEFLRDTGVRIIGALIEEHNLPSMALFSRCEYVGRPDIVYFRKELRS